MRRHRAILAIVATDLGFVRTRVAGEECHVGPCIHCGRKLVVALDGQTSATIEHIVPRAHGGRDELENLALACARCNAGKGARHDHRALDDPARVALVERLRARRAARFRAPGPDRDPVGAEHVARFERERRRAGPTRSPRSRRGPPGRT